MVPEVNEIETEGITTGLTVIVIPEDVALTGLTQNADDVITHVTICEFANVDVVNVGLLLPSFTPFTFH